MMSPQCDVPSMSPSLATSETLKCATKFVARDMQMFFGDNRNSSCLRDMQMTRGTCCSLVTRIFSYLGRHAEYIVTCEKSPSLATVLRCNGKMKNPTPLSLTII